MLIDAGPLIAFIDQNDADHSTCRYLMKSNADVPLVTTWACLAEASHILGRNAGIAGQLPLMQLVCNREVSIFEPSALDCERICDLMSKYRDLPMDLADATLVVAAEALGIREVFTLDRHFQAYRTTGDQSLTVLP